MAQVQVINQENAVVGTTHVSDEIVGESARSALIHEVVLMQLAGKRAGTHQTKTRSFVSGGGKKPWKQKGTGRARSGSNRSPIWRGGGVIFGPMPRDYSYTMPKKKVKLALRSILSAKYAENRLNVLDGLTLGGKTKEAALMLKRFEVDRGALFIVDKVDEKALRAFRNIPFVNILAVSGLNVYDIVNARKIFILKDALSSLEKRLALGGTK